MPKRLSPQERALRAISEAQFQRFVQDLLTLNGYQLQFHVADSRKMANGRMIGDKGAVGFPDILAIRPADGDILVIECKSRTGRVRPEQIEWLDAFRDAGVDAYLWRPGDEDEIMCRLRRQRGDLSEVPSELAVGDGAA